MFFRLEKIHFIGIGGAGMCPIAEFMHKNRHAVSGSDIMHSPSTHRLESLGIKIQYNHTPDIVRDAELIVYSSAIDSKNPELIYARENGIKHLKRAKFLGDIMRTMFSIGIAGTHGKTTTSSIIGNILSDAKMDPTVIIGGAFKKSESNAIVGKGKTLVVEADEYDRSFLYMYPSVAVVTNIEAEHLDIYKDLSDIKNAFVEFVNRIPFYGMAAVCVDDIIAKQIIPDLEGRVKTYGLSSSANYRAENIEHGYNQTKFDVYKNEIKIGSIIIPLIGIHNIRNCLAAITVACEMNVTFEIVKESIEKYQGMKRRFEILGKKKNVTIVDDYAHHPTEISATQIAAKKTGFKRVIAVFQPHLYSRTRDFLDGFAQSLMDFDIVFITPIYEAREKPIEGVESSNIVLRMEEKGHKKVYYLKDMYDISDSLLPMLMSNDVVIFMGAGDIWKAGKNLLDRINNG